MIKFKEISVPDHEDFRNVNILEIMVSEGDKVEQHDPLISVENSKGDIKSMPCPMSGTITEVIVMPGERVSVGTPIILLETVEHNGEQAIEQPLVSPGTQNKSADEGQVELNLSALDDAPDQDVLIEPSGADRQFVVHESSENKINKSENDSAEIIDLVVPDIGDFEDVEVIDVLVNIGDQIQREESLVSLESDKATMDVPATDNGTVVEIMVIPGDRVSQGSTLARLQLSGSSENLQTLPAQNTAIDDDIKSDNKKPPVSEPTIAPEEKIADQEPGEQKPQQKPVPPPVPTDALTPVAPDQGRAHASPAIRRFARELGVDLNHVTGSGNKGRILKTDVQVWVKHALSQPSGAVVSSGMGIPPIPEIDFSQFGDIQTEPLNRIKRLTAVHLHRSWLNVPHVTHNDEADITELEEFRQSKKQDAMDRGIRLTLLAFTIKAVVSALKKYPSFNASLDTGGENLILKHYYNIGIAVETKSGLVVPVVRDVHQKGIFDLATELGEISERARNNKLKTDDLQGGSFTISSLGGIGGISFAPIVNAPEVAILGVSRSSIRPVYKDGAFIPRLLLPLSLSYDHRVIDGAEAARFTVYLSNALADVRTLLL